MPARIRDFERMLSGDDIDSAEIALGVRFPAEYRRFLLSTNGGRSRLNRFEIDWKGNLLGQAWRSSKVDWFLSIYDDQYSNLIEYNCVDYLGRIPADTIAIAHDPGGNLILLGVGDDSNGKVFFWVKDHEAEEGDVPGYDNIGFLANSLPEFLDKLR